MHHSKKKLIFNFFGSCSEIHWLFFSLSHSGTNQLEIFQKLMIHDFISILILENCFNEKNSFGVSPLCGFYGAPLIYDQIRCASIANLRIFCSHDTLGLFMVGHIHLIMDLLFLFSSWLHCHIFLWIINFLFIVNVKQGFCYISHLHEIRSHFENLIQSSIHFDMNFVHNSNEFIYLAKEF